MSEPRQQAAYPLRIPLELREQLEKAAEQNKRSLNAEITARLEESFHDQIDHSELPTAEQARKLAASARKELVARVRQIVLHDINRAILQGSDILAIDLSQFPLLEDDSEAASEVADPIIKELNKAGYSTDWMGSCTLIVRFSSD